MQNLLQDQIDNVLRAYATLVRAARAANDQKAVAGYIEETLQYADGLLQRGQDGGYPRLSMRVAQILRLGGEPEAADRARANQRPELFGGSLSARFELSASIDVDQNDWPSPLIRIRSKPHGIIRAQPQ